MKQVQKVKPFNCNEQLLQEFKERYSNFARSIGVDTTKTANSSLKRHNIVLCFCIQVLTLTVNVLDIGLMIYEHWNGRGAFFKDIRTVTVNIGILCTSIPGIILVRNNDKLVKVLNWSESIALDSTLLTEQINYVKIANKAAIWLPICSAAFALIMTILTKNRLLIVPIYSPDLINESFVIYVIVFITFTGHTFTFWRLSVFALVTFINLVKFVSRQYQVMCEILQKTCRDQMELGKVISEIGRMHSEVQQNLTILSELFDMSLIMNEMFCVAVASMAVTSFLYQPNEMNFAITALISCGYKLLYPKFGQEISSAAEDFERTVYEIDWHQLSARNRKSLALVLLMSQKPVGVTSGGFHLSNYTEISQIFKLSYNLIIFIKKRQERQ